MKLYLLPLLILIQFIAAAQEEDLLKSLPADSVTSEKVASPFKSTRVIMSHSLKMLDVGVLDFRILHRFGTINSGLSNLFGLDGPANVRLGFDYGISNNFTIGVGRTTFKKELDGFIKWQLLQQTTGIGAIPVTLIGVAGSTLRTLKWTDGREHQFTDKLGYYGQAIIGRKFNDRFTLQLAPTVVYRNYVESSTYDHLVFAAGIGSRLQISPRTSLNIDYYLIPNKDDFPGASNPLSIGFDIETGGHVFQLHFTNAYGMNERSFITETNYSWGKGEIEFGFNISRVFQIKKKKSN